MIFYNNKQINNNNNNKMNKTMKRIFMSLVYYNRKLNPYKELNHSLIF